MTRFDRDTAVHALGGGCFEGRIDPGWWIVRGPNGGILAALLLRAMQEAVGEPERAARSLTVHYTSPPAEGPVLIETVVERRGRSLSTLSARMEQQGKRIALALAAFSRPREALEFHDLRMPEVPPPEALPGPPEPATIPFRERFETRPALGAPAWSGGDEAYTGGWIRLAEPRPLDAPLVAAYTDAWIPAVFTRTRPEQLSAGVPTVDLTVHFRAPVPRPGAPPDEWVFVVFRTHLAHQGFIEEDGEVWSRDGTLLAQSRQLAVLI